MLKIDELISISHIEKIGFEKLNTKRFNGVSIDSRGIKKNEIFFAIKGERTDGHRFLDDVFKKGVKLAVVNDDWYRKNRRRIKTKTLLTVKDTIKALGEFAKVHKEKFRIPILCIGGSNGKTTTKDITAAVLSKKYNVLKTEGNFNNHIGLPLTLLRMTGKNNFCVLEVGCNHYGEIKYLCSIAEPDYGMITNIGREHLEFFKTLKGVSKAEFELFDYIRQKEGGVLFLNYDDSFIKKYSRRISDEKKFSYSYQFNTDVKGRFEGYTENFEPKIKIKSDKKKFETYISTFGKHSVYNGIAAAAAGLYFGISPENIKHALQNFKPTSSKRMEILKSNGAIIINDTYNSNPESVMMGLETMLEYKTSGEKIAVLSDMLELGESSIKEHTRIGRFAFRIGIKNLYTYGKESYNTFYGGKRIKNNFHFESKKDMVRMLKKNIKADDVVYVKGSRGMRMEEVVKGITEN